MMILRSSPASPFGRKVKIAAAILGLDKEINVEKADTTDASDTIRKQNPLGKIPALILEDGSVLHDSPVILDYLDHRAGGGKIIPKEPDARFAALTLEALCDGILDAQLLQVYEGRYRPAEKYEAKWIELQAGKVTRASSKPGARGSRRGAIRSSCCAVTRRGASKACYRVCAACSRSASSTFARGACTSCATAWA